ncbi:hypothetical protein OA498_02575 [Candidatus Pelagibacter bacterium]|nr:hypothetical protein [Candidatus Pelagibacter bacterium]
MLQINPKKFKSIQNKTIPSPMRPKFRNSGETNIYFYSKKKVENEKKNKIFKTAKVWLSLLALVVGGYLLSN